MTQFSLKILLSGRKIFSVVNSSLTEYDIVKSKKGETGILIELRY